jgi:triphosphatase
MSTFPDEPPSALSVENLPTETIDRRLEATDWATFEAWLLARAGQLGFSLTFGPVQDHTDIYLDTDDWRFHRASYGLRLRRQAPAGAIVAQLRRLDEAAGGPPSPEPRREVSEPLENGRIETLCAAPGPVGQRLRALAGSMALRPLFAVQTRRKIATLTREAAPAVVVTADETRILRGPSHAPVYLLQIRVKGPAGALVDAGCQEGVVWPAERSRYRVGIEALALTPPSPPEFGPADIGATLSLGEVALAVLRRQFTAFLAHEPGTRLGDDVEGLHRMRVASRKLRAALSLFAECLPARAERFRDELRWVATTLGEVRDIDVQLERVQTWQGEANLADQGVLEPLTELLVAQRARAQAHMLAMLDSRRYAHFVRAFSGMLKSGLPQPPHLPAAHRLAVEEAPALIVDRYRQVRQAGDDLTNESPPPKYHALRICGKRLRYALEFMTEIYGEPAAELARHVVALQDVLGLHQDAMVAMAQLRALAETHSRQLPPPTIFAMGEITQRYAHLAADCLLRFPELYGRVQGKPWKKLRQALKAHQPPSAPELAQPE